MRSLIDLQTRMRGAILGAPEQPLLDAIVSDRLSARSRLELHRNHYRVSLKCGLADVFPATRILVGERYFDALADRFIRAHPPDDPCLARYGGRFPGFLAERDDARLAPFVPELSMLEWALVEVRNAPEVAAITRERYQRAVARCGGAFSVRFAPAVALRHYAWPVHRIRDATLADASLETLSALVERRIFTTLLLHRDTSAAPCCITLDAAADAAARCLRAGRPVEVAVRAALAVDREFQVAEFLVFLVDNGLVSELVEPSSALCANHREI